MATRRKYRPKAYRDGGAVLADTASDDPAPPAAATADAPAPPPEIAAPPPDDGAVLRALEAQRHAEEMVRADALRRQQEQQQQQQRPQPSERMMAFVKANPEITRPENAEIVQFYFSQGQSLGIPDDSEEMDQYVLRGLQHERGVLDRIRAEPRANPAPAPPQAQPAPLQPQPAPAPPARSMPMTAPVSREIPAYSGKRPSSSMHLTEEERQIARAAIIDRPDMPPLTDAQKEYLYLKNRERYRQMVASGEYSEQRQR
jgi:hypothetical protein